MKNNRDGFTLVELLVVIAIIALLMSIIVPALRKAKAQAHKVICQSQQKQFGLAWVLYAEDNDNKNIVVYNKDGYAFYNLIGQYFGDGNKFMKSDEDGMHGTTRSGAMEVMRCPATKPWVNIADGQAYGRADRCWGLGNIQGSYAYNGWMTSHDFSDHPYYYKNFLSAPGKAPLFADAGFGDVWPESEEADQARELIDLQGAGLPGKYRMETSFPRLMLMRHGRAINMLFKDTSVETVELEKVWSFKWHPGFKTIEKIEGLPRE